MIPSNKRQRTSLSLPTTVNDLTSDLWCVSADFLSSKTFSAFLQLRSGTFGVLEKERLEGPAKCSELSSTTRRVLH